MESFYFLFLTLGLDIVVSLCIVNTSVIVNKLTIICGLTILLIATKLAVCLLSGMIYTLADSFSKKLKNQKNYRLT